MTEHVPKNCDITGCRLEASYWIDTAEGFIENLLKTQEAADTFYLCLSHQSDLMSHGDNAGFYVHLRIDTGEITTHEIGKYACADDCDVCADS
jgi:hypothetical protein